MTPNDRSRGVRLRGVTPVPLPSEVVREREREHSSGAHPDTKIDIVSIENGPETIDDFSEGLLSDIFVYAEAEKAQEEGYDAVLIDCVFDGPLYALRNRLRIPVIGPMEASMHIAGMLGHKFSIVCPMQEWEHLFREQAKRYGVDDRLASVRGIQIPFQEMLAREEEVKKKLLEESNKAIAQDDADVIILGCTGLVGIDKWMAEKLRVPVLAPGRIGLKMAEFLVELGLSHSRTAFLETSRKYRDIMQALRTKMVVKA